MEEQKNGETKEVKDFDIVWLIKYFWANRKLVGKIVAATVVVAIVMYFCKPKVFTSGASILPLSSSAAKLGNLSSLASMAGINLGSASTDEITPDLFGEVATSTTSLLEIMNKPMTWTEPEDTVESLYSHMKRDTLLTVGRAIMKYTIQLPFTIKTALTKEPPIVAELPDSADESAPIMLDMVMSNCIKDLQKRITIEVDDEVNIVRISCTAPNAKQSSELAQAVLARIQESVTEFTTKNARKNLEFVQKQYDEASERYRQKREAWFRYKDTHRNVIEERATLANNELYEEYNTAYQLMTSMQTAVEQGKLELAKSTPAFSIVEPVVTPIKKTSPKLLLHLIGGFIFGIVISVGGMLVILGYKQVFKPEEYEAIYDKYIDA